MPADFWVVVEFLGFVVAGTFVVVGVWKLNPRLLGAGAVLAGIAWLGIAFTTSDEWIGREFVTLRLRPIDASRREMVVDAVVHAIGPAETGSVAYRLPARLEGGSDGDHQILAVSLVVEMRVQGSLVDQYSEPAAHIQVGDQALEITAPGYRPWRGSLTELLPVGWPIATAESPIVVEMQPE